MPKTNGDSRARALLDAVISRHDYDAANGLIGVFYSGYPIEVLDELLQSADEELVNIVLWLCSELGELVRPLLPRIAELIGRHPRPSGRCYAIECVLLASRSEDGPILTAAVQAIRDPDFRVRAWAAQFLARTSTGHLRGAAAALSDERVREKVELVIAQDDTAERYTDSRHDDSDDELDGLFEAVAAARRSEVEFLGQQAAVRGEQDTIGLFCAFEHRFVARDLARMQRGRAPLVEVRAERRAKKPNQ